MIFDLGVLFPHSGLGEMIDSALNVRELASAFPKVVLAIRRQVGQLLGPRQVTQSVPRDAYGSGGENGGRLAEGENGSSESEM